VRDYRTGLTAVRLAVHVSNRFRAWIYRRWRI